MSTRESKSASAAQGRPRQSRQRDRRQALLAALRQAGRPLDVADAAAAVGISEPTARFHLSMLVSAGQVRRTAVRGGSVGRPAWRYEPASEAAETAPGAYRELARVLAERLEGEAGAAAAARDAGRRWAAALPDRASAADDHETAVASLTRALDGLGFAPEVRPSADEIVLHACPFEDVARDHRAVVCGVHLGLVEAAAASIGGGLAVEALEPFRSEEPLTCAVRLRRPS